MDTTCTNAVSRSTRTNRAGAQGLAPDAAAGTQDAQEAVTGVAVKGPGLIVVGALLQDGRHQIAIARKNRTILVNPGPFHAIRTNRLLAEVIINRVTVLAAL